MFPTNLTSVNITEAYDILKPLFLFVIGMTIYAIFIFKFYRFIARKDIFELNLKQYNRARHPLLEKLFALILYIIEYILLFPVLTFFWFGTLAALLTFMSPEPVIEHVVLISISVVAVIRITAYYNEELSKDLAKMLPFALLGVFIVDMSYFSFSASYEVLKTMPSFINLLIYYLVFVIFLEFVLRILYLIANTPNEKREQYNPQYKKI